MATIWSADSRSRTTTKPCARIAATSRSTACVSIVMTMCASRLACPTRLPLSTRRRLRQRAHRCNQEPMVDIEMHDGIALLRFARPPANAIELESARALEEALVRLEADASVHAVVITGQGAFFS